MGPHAHTRTHTYATEIKPVVNERVLETLARKRTVIYSCGSFYTSIMPCLIVKGVRRARTRPPRPTAFLNSHAPYPHAPAPCVCVCRGAFYPSGGQRGRSIEVSTQGSASERIPGPRNARHDSGRLCPRLSRRAQPVARGAAGRTPAALPGLYIRHPPLLRPVRAVGRALPAPPVPRRGAF